MVGFEGGNESAILTKCLRLKNAVVVASIVDAGCHKNSGASIIIQTGLDGKVMNDIGNNPGFALFCTHQVFHRCPAPAQNSFLKVV
ncbi:hypothetical protein D3C85_1410200 [compost metagenome]